MFRNCINAIPIPSDCNELYDGMTFNGCDYFFTVPNKCKIICYSPCFSYQKCIKTCRPYSSICYDFKDNCYYASSRTEYYKIYKLNENFKEIDYIYINPCTECGAIILGVSYDCQNDAILIATCNKVLRYKKCNELLEILFCSNKIWISGVLSISPGYLVIGRKCGEQYIYVVDCHNNILRECRWECSSDIKNIVLNPCHKLKKHKISFIIYGVKKSFYPYVYEIDMPIYELNFKLCPCNYFVCKNKCECEHSCSKDACTEVMESVAKVETALSHILNAEGEKLQKVIATTDDIDKILEVNSQVNKTIVNATHLEHTLYAKLEALNNCCDFCDKDFNCCDKDNICTCNVDGGTINK